jgi:hypothetical protein
LNWSGSSCHASFFGIVTKCHSSGSESEASIVTNLNMHFITSNNKPAVLVTGTFPTVVCVALTTIKYGGNGVIGTITSPACKTKSKSLTMGFGTSEGKQADRLYTGVEYGLTAETEPEGSAATATFTASLTLSSNSELEMTCQ